MEDLLPEKLSTRAQMVVSGAQLLLLVGVELKPKSFLSDHQWPNIWQWGNSSTELKRWGTNRIETSLNRC